MNVSFTSKLVLHVHHSKAVPFKMMNFQPNKDKS